MVIECLLGLQPVAWYSSTHSYNLTHPWPTCLPFLQHTGWKNMLYFHSTFCIIFFLFCSSWVKLSEIKPIFYTNKLYNAFSITSLLKNSVYVREVPGQLCEIVLLLQGLPGFQGWSSDCQMCVIRQGMLSCQPHTVCLLECVELLVQKQPSFSDWILFFRWLL